MSSYKKIDSLRDFASGVCLSEAQNPIPPPPPHTVYCTCTVYGGEGGEIEPGRRLEGHQSLVENNNMTDCISSLLNTDKHLPQSLFTGQFFR